MADKKEQVTITGIVGKEEYQGFYEGTSERGYEWKLFKFSIGVSAGGDRREYTVCLAWDKKNNQLATQWRDKLKEDSFVTATGTMEANTYDGKTTLQLICKSIAIVEGESDPPAPLPTTQIDAPVEEEEAVDPMDENFL